jgi:hypothetical protein
MKKKTIFDAAYYSLAALFVFAFVWVHFVADFTFPVPWPDEAVFVQQAISFQQHGSLLSPQLNPSRDVFWMPPGYMLLLGAFFKLAAPGLFAARLFSLILTTLVFIVITAFLRDERSRLFLLTLSGLFFLNRFFVIMGNIARMEPLLILGVVTAMLLFYGAKPYKAILLLFLLPLVHPNAVYFLLVGLLWFVVQEYYLKEESRANLSDRLLIIAALMLVAGYLVYAALHWGDFISDVTYQLARKGKRNLALPFTAWSSRVFLCVSFLAFILSLAQKKRKLILLTLFAVAAWMVNKIGQELWYQVFDSFAYLLIGIVVIQLLNPKQSLIQFAALFLVAVYIFAGLEEIENPRGYPFSMKWVDMRVPAGVEYFTRADKDKIRGLIEENKRKEGLLRVKFYPSGDALFFHDMEGKTIRSIYPAQEALIFPPQRHDLFLVHLSRYEPKGWGWSYLPWILEDAKIDTMDKKYLLFERNSTEKWYYRFDNSTGGASQGPWDGSARKN